MWSKPKAYKESLSIYFIWQSSLYIDNSIHYVIEFVINWPQVGGFPGYSVSSTNNTDRHEYNWNIVESGVKHHNP